MNTRKEVARVTIGIAEARRTVTGNPLHVSQNLFDRCVAAGLDTRNLVVTKRAATDAVSPARPVVHSGVSYRRRE